MYDRILVATDGSESASAVVEEAVGLARLSGATLHALSVVDTRDYNTLPETKWLSVDEALTEEAEAAVEDVRERAVDSRVTVETAVESGVPHETIVAYATDHDVDLVVMGTHGRSGIDHFLLGSVAENVLRFAPVPVHVVRVGPD
ncbi:MAG: universal stress protein [Halanaeroarchaeum sp.]